VVDGLPAEVCKAYFDNEFLVEDVNKFSALEAGPRIATLHRATAGRSTASARHNEINAPLGFAPELRATFSTEAGSWGAMNLLRETGAPDFSDGELAFLRSVSGHIAEGLRAALRCAPDATPALDDEPAVAVFDEDGALVSCTAAAERSLTALDGQRVAVDDRSTVPAAAYMVVMRARALALGRPARARLQNRDGRWLALSASCPVGADGAVRHTVLVVEPARPAHLAPIIVEAYGLSPREQEVVRLLARGCDTATIARTLWISPHTVRDHVKAVFAKVGVANRQELLSRLFHDELPPRMANY
jgi:DNA-binding CsgD family transcriptional regulator